MNYSNKYTGSSYNTTNYTMYSFIHSKSSNLEYSIADGYSCDATPYKIGDGSPTLFKSIVPEKKKVKLRYNHQCTSSKDMWKIYIDDYVHIVGQVNFQIPTATTLDYDESSKDYKAHVSCNARFVKFETMPDGQIIATVS